MQKWKSVVFLTLLALVGLIVGLGRIAKNQRANASAQPSATASASATPSSLPLPAASEQDAPAAEPEPSAVPSGASPASALPANAPNDVVFGAILVTFEGVQGAPSKSRTKAAALEMAQRILVTAQTSFEDAVRMGDPGSMANAGTMRRGILEPTVEYALFTLEKGAIYPEPVETPRGYWIMRRIK